MSETATIERRGTSAKAVYERARAGLAIALQQALREKKEYLQEHALRTAPSRVWKLKVNNSSKTLKSEVENSETGSYFDKLSENKISLRNGKHEKGGEGEDADVKVQDLSVVQRAYDVFVAAREAYVQEAYANSWDEKEINALLDADENFFRSQVRETFADERRGLKRWFADSAVGIAVKKIDKLHPWLKYPIKAVPATVITGAIVLATGGYSLKLKAALVSARFISATVVSGAYAAMVRKQIEEDVKKNMEAEIAAAIGGFSKEQTISALEKIRSIRKEKEAIAQRLIGFRTLRATLPVAILLGLPLREIALGVVSGTLFAATETLMHEAANVTTHALDQVHPSALFAAQAADFGTHSQPFNGSGGNGQYHGGGYRGGGGQRGGFNLRFRLGFGGGHDMRHGGSYGGYHGNGGYGYQGEGGEYGRGEMHSVHREQYEQHYRRVIIPHHDVATPHQDCVHTQGTETRTDVLIADIEKTLKELGAHPFANSRAEFFDAAHIDKLIEQYRGAGKSPEFLAALKQWLITEGKLEKYTSITLDPHSKFALMANVFDKHGHLVHGVQLDTKETYPAETGTFRYTDATGTHEITMVVPEKIGVDAHGHNVGCYNGALAKDVIITQTAGADVCLPVGTEGAPRHTIGDAGDVALLNQLGNPSTHDFLNHYRDSQDPHIKGLWAYVEHHKRDMVSPTEYDSMPLIDALRRAVGGGAR